MSTTKHPLPIQNEIESCNQYLIRFDKLSDSVRRLRKSLREEDERGISINRQIFDMDLNDFLNSEMGCDITMTQSIS